MDTYAAIGEPNRRFMLDQMRDGPRTVGHLVEAVGLSQPVVSKHLRVLKDAGLVTVQPDGQRRWYRLNPQPLTELEEWLEPYRKYWGERLDALERHLNDTAGEEK